MEREQRWEIKYEMLKGTEWVQRKCYPRTAEKRDESIEILKSKDNYRLISCQKMYPFDMWNNQHNFELISNICYNRMRDMEDNEIPFDHAEYDRLDALKEKADRLFMMMTGPITWLVWDDLKDAKELSMMAVNHRMNACIENGRPDLVQYC